MKKINLVDLAEKHLDIVFQWRNLPDVRNNMYTNHEITMEEHTKWFNRISKDITKKYFVFELDNIPCGVIGFVDIDHINRSSSWAFYSGDTTVRGVGSLMETTALNYAFEELKLKKLYCEVLEFNESVVKFHKKHGFKVEGIFKKHYFRDTKYWDIYRLAIFEEDWIKAKHDLLNKVKGGLSPGKSYTHALTITEEQIVDFANVTGDINKIHFDDNYAKANGFNGKLVHGFLAASVFSKVFGTLFPGEGTVYLGQSMNFVSPVYPNDPLEAVFRISSKTGRQLLIDTTIINTHTGTTVVTGEAKLLAPKS